MRIVRGAEEARATLLRARLPSTSRSCRPPSARRSRRVFGADLDAAGVVDRILRDVRESGDAAVRGYNEQIDGVNSTGRWKSAATRSRPPTTHVDAALVERCASPPSASATTTGSRCSTPSSSFEENGLGQLVRPIERVGLYIPGNKVIYPSTVLMTALPARAAGVAELFMVTPAREDGSVAPLKLVAADIAGVDRIFRAGGVAGHRRARLRDARRPEGGQDLRARQHLRDARQAAAVRRGRHRRRLRPVGDDRRRRRPRADPAGRRGPARGGGARRAGDGDPDHGLPGAGRGRRQDRRRASWRSSTRGDVARISLEARGGAVVVRSITEAVELASEFAPEHLCLQMRDAERCLDHVHNAGCIFVGEQSVESVGDYTAGPEPRHADGRRGPLHVGARRARLPEGDEPGAAGPRDRAGDRPRRGRDRLRGGAHRPRASHRGPAWRTSDARRSVDEKRPARSCARTSPPCPATSRSSRSTSWPDGSGSRADQISKLDGNENPYGPSPKVAERLAAYSALPHLP